MSRSSSRWLRRQRRDRYVDEAQKSGYRSRAWFKLQAMDEKFSLFTKAQRVIDLGAAPGAWSQYVSGRTKVRWIVASDVLTMAPIAGLTFVQGDFTDQGTLHRIHQTTAVPFDVVLSDMAPNMSGNPVIDIPRAMYLSELARDFAVTHLRADGHCVIKAFQGSGFEGLTQSMRAIFHRNKIFKPEASRKASREVYLIGLNKRSPADLSIDVADSQSVASVAPSSNAWA